jgi:hypothetical protein
VLDPPPGPLVLGSLLGEDQPALLVLLLEHEGLDGIPDLDDLCGVDVVADRQLFRRDDAFGLVADVHEDLVAVHLHDGALEDVAFLEVLQGLLDRPGQLLRRQVARLDSRVLRFLDLNQLLPAQGTSGTSPPPAEEGVQPRRQPLRPVEW